MTNWLPLNKFNPATDLPAIRDRAKLRNGIHDVVTDIYCEFNVQCSNHQPPAGARGRRRNPVGVGTDPSLRPDCHDPLRREPQEAGGDTSTKKPEDYARGWAGGFPAGGGGGGGALGGSLSTTERWASSIGSTIAHEADTPWPVACRR